ncbi:MAG: hypothetical protein Q4G24_05710 [Paracoccus sp. (in: a-proteobacteria)]|uniref:hypothetical protein n=1 Tax=Paracoccus sp. TaxID=267 RepID=UPI0026E01DBF|nr:hypothetical protein [Paracoccus sp. (in: a-proteobacteria)]MDO5620949.1 hypothetical protein [Paracoccus sp. (in: a-proteobacteria)]
MPGGPVSTVLLRRYAPYAATGAALGGIRAGPAATAVLVVLIRGFMVLWPEAILVRLDKSAVQVPQ